MLPTSGGASPRNRILFIDTLRGLSAVSVVLFHMIFLTDPPMSPPRLFTFFSVGGVGVTMFFLISAYSLSMTMPRHLQTGHGLFSFYLHRACRILPLFYVLLCISLYFFTNRGIGFNTFQIMINFLCLYNFFPGQQESIVMAGWTIGVEMLFYCVFPLLYKYSNTMGRLLALFAVTLALSYGFQLVCPSVNYVRFTIIRHFPIFVWGMLLFHLGEQAKRITNFRIPISLLLCATAVASFRYIISLPQYLEMNYYLQIIPFTCLFIGLLLFPLPILVSPLTASLGTISYSTYLVHPLVIVTVRPVYGGLARLDLGPTMTFALCACLTLVVVLPLAYVFYVYVEKPGIRCGKWIMAARFGAAPARGPQREELAMAASPIEAK